MLKEEGLHCAAAPFICHIQRRPAEIVSRIDLRAVVNQSFRFRRIVGKCRLAQLLSQFRRIFAATGEQGRGGDDEKEGNYIQYATNLGRIPAGSGVAVARVRPVRIAESGVGAGLKFLEFSTFEMPVPSIAMSNAHSAGFWHKKTAGKFYA